MVESGRKRRVFPDAFQAGGGGRGARRPFDIGGGGRTQPCPSLGAQLAWLGREPSERRERCAGADDPKIIGGAGAARGTESGRPGSRDRPAAARSRSREDGARHLKASGAHLRPGCGPEVSYRFIRSNVADFPIQLMCEVLEVSRSGYYAWISRADAESQARKDRVCSVSGRFGKETRTGARFIRTENDGAFREDL
jgi:hypothetical protein